MTSTARTLRALAIARRAIDQVEAGLHSSSIVRSSTIDKAKAFVLEAVREQPQSLSTSALRRLARGRRLSNEAVSRALQALRDEGTLMFVGGARSSRLWYLTDSSQNAPPCLPGRVSARERSADEVGDLSTSPRAHDGD